VNNFQGILYGLSFPVTQQCQNTEGNNIDCGKNKEKNFFKQGELFSDDTQGWIKAYGDTATTVLGPLKSYNFL